MKTLLLLPAVLVLSLGVAQAQCCKGAKATKAAKTTDVTDDTKATKTTKATKPHGDFGDVAPPSCCPASI